MRINCGKKKKNDSKMPNHAQKKKKIVNCGLGIRAGAGRLVSKADSSAIVCKQVT